MKHPSDPVPDKPLDYGKPLSLDTFLYSPGNIVKVVSWHGLGYSLVQGLPRHFQQTGRALTDIPYRKGSCGVSVKTLKLNSKIYGQNISLDKRPRGWKPMDNLFVERTAKGVRKTQVPFERRNNLVSVTEVVREIFELPGRHPGSHFASKFVENLRRDAVGFPENGYFLIILQEDATMLFQPCLPLIFALANSPSYLPEIRCDWTWDMVSMATPTTMSREVPP